MVDAVATMAEAYDLTLAADQPALKRGSLLLLAGLPASGKSMLAGEILRRIPAVLVSTDAARKHLGQEPTYSDQEMAWVYEACYRVIATRLTRRQRVIFDASNHRRERRRAVYGLAKRAGAAIAVCEVWVSPKTARERLAARHSASRRPDDFSDAAWSVYRWMEERYQPIQHPKLELESGRQELDQAAQRVIAYWRQLETG